MTAPIQSQTPDAATARPRFPEILLPAAMDVVLVLIFAASGRGSHHEGMTLAGLWETAWPFLAALALSWLAARVWLRPSAILRSGLPVWIGTVALGMILRVLLTAGSAPIAFVVVASTVLGVFLLGWRAVWALIRRARNPKTRAASVQPTR